MHETMVDSHYAGGAIKVLRAGTDLAYFSGRLRS